jgi:hypothetical protein
MIMPTIHNNGTGKESLLNQTLDTMTAITDALGKLREAAPHARDYYPQGEEAYKTARTEHEARIQKLMEVYTELETMAIFISDQ